MFKRSVAGFCSKTELIQATVTLENTNIDNSDNNIDFQTKLKLWLPGIIIDNYSYARSACSRFSESRKWKIKKQTRPKQGRKLGALRSLPSSLVIFSKSTRRVFPSWLYLIMSHPASAR